MITTPPAHGLHIVFHKRDSELGVTRETVKAMAEHFKLSEAEVVHLALSSLAAQVLPAYQADDGPLRRQAFRALRQVAEASLPKGRVVKTASLL